MDDSDLQLSCGVVLLLWWLWCDVGRIVLWPVACGCGWKEVEMKALYRYDKFRIGISRKAKRL